MSNQPNPYEQNYEKWQTYHFRCNLFKMQMQYCTLKLIRKSFQSNVQGQEKCVNKL
jgi:hypothetical protein